MLHSSPVRRMFVTAATALALVAATAAPAWARYLVDYGDSLSVTVLNAPQYSFSGSIRPDGVVTLPVLGDMEVRGLSTEQVRDRIREQVGRVLRDPVVTVTVTNYKARTITVIGEVARPGSVEITRADMSVLDAIAAAGGFTDHAIPKEIVVLRGNGAATRSFPVDMEAMLRTGDLSANLKIEPGDRIQIPRSPWPTWTEVITLVREVSTVVGIVTVIYGLRNLIGGGNNNNFN